MKLSPAFTEQLRSVLLLEAQNRHPEAITLLQSAAKAGNPQARCYLGQKLLLGERMPQDVPKGLQMLTMAGAAGSGDALHLLATLAAAGQARSQDWSAALKALQRAAQSGHETAGAQLALLQSPGAKFDIETWRACPPPRMQFENPCVGVIENFLSPEVCAWLIACGRTRLAPAMVRDRQTGDERVSHQRTNSAAYLPLMNSDVLMQAVRERIAASLGVPVANLEAPNVLHYRVGQAFEQHFDFSDPALPAHAEELARLGQRTATFLVYLNEGFEGGETAFPTLNWSFRGRTGDALFFWNVDEHGAVEHRLLHAGMPPTQGEKWLLSQWVRERPIPLI